MVNYGHRYDRPPTAADKIVDFVAITSAGKTSLLDGISATQVGGASVVVSQPFADERPTLLAVPYDNGYWVKITDKLLRNASRRLVPDAMDSLWSATSAKALTEGAPWSTVVGHELELVPLEDPSAIRPGNSLRLRLLFRGSPLAGAQVERGDGVTAIKEAEIPRFSTDRDGITVIPIEKPGPILLAVDHRVVPSGTPGIAAADLFDATLWFLIADLRSHASDKASGLRIQPAHLRAGEDRTRLLARYFAWADVDRYRQPRATRVLRPNTSPLPAGLAQNVRQCEPFHCSVPISLASLAKAARNRRQFGRRPGTNSPPRRRHLSDERAMRGPCS